MRKRKKYIQVIISMMVLLVVSINLCSCHEKYYFEYAGIWYSEIPLIELDCVNGLGSMTLNEMEYKLHLSFANNAVSINIYDQSMIDAIAKDKNGNYMSGATEDMLLWRADTVVKDGKLYLTVTKDNISDYEGKTIELKLRPYKEGEDVYPEEE